MKYFLIIIFALFSSELLFAQDSIYVKNQNLNCDVASIIDTLIVNEELDTTGQVPKLIRIEPFIDSYRIDTSKITDSLIIKFINNDLGKLNYITKDSNNTYKNILHLEDSLVSNYKLIYTIWGETTLYLDKWAFSSSTTTIKVNNSNLIHRGEFIPERKNEQIDVWGNYCFIIVYIGYPYIGARRDAIYYTEKYYFTRVTQ